MSNIIALVSLDFERRRQRSRRRWTRIEVTMKAYLTEIRNRLDKAAGIGRAADACAGAGFHEKGLEVALDIEQVLYEATTLLNAASLINRIARQS
jgi:phage-related minor tail protein